METAMHGVGLENNVFDITDPKVIWISDEPDTVVFEPNTGNLRALSAGGAQVRATLGAVESDWFEVTILDLGVVIESSADPLVRGEFWQPETVEVQDVCGPSPWCEVKWQSGDRGVFEVDQEGLGWAVPTSWGSGIASKDTTLTAALENSFYFEDWCQAEITGTVGITVEREVSEIEVSPSQSSIDIGETLQLTPSVIDDLGDLCEAPPVTFVWSSGNPGVARVGEEGLVTAIANGSATISAESQDAIGTALIGVGIKRYQITWTITGSGQYNCCNGENALDTTFNCSGNALLDWDGSVELT
ncbi:MAG: Ig-like domain-containing protein [Thermoanaerobaculia bacterium]